MPTSRDWEVVTIPSYPPAPASIEFSAFDIVALSKSPFTGQQQVQDWGPGPMEAKVSLPPLTDAQAQPWISFLFALKGMANVFQFTPEFTAAYPASLGDRFWRLKSNQRSWSINGQRLYGISFEIIEAL
jgi:hypothetical protein